MIHTLSHRRLGRKGCTIPIPSGSLTADEGDHTSFYYQLTSGQETLKQPRVARRQTHAGITHSEVRWLESQSNSLPAACIRDATSAAISASEQLRDHCRLDGRRASRRYICPRRIPWPWACISHMGMYLRGVHLTHGRVSYRHASHKRASTYRRASHRHLT